MLVWTRLTESGRPPVPRAAPSRYHGRSSSLGGYGMRRREFIVGGAAVCWPLASRAQPAMPVVGFVHPSSPEAFQHVVAGFRKGLEDTGFIEGRDVSIEYRWARGEYNRLQDLAADLVRRRSRVILAGGGEVGALAAKAVTSAVPILIITSSDPVSPAWSQASIGPEVTSRA
jgi:putative tryptophan/tyrosine transport system substrate-binding protein